MATSTTVIPAHLPNKRKRRRTNRKKISIKKANNKLKIDSDCYENDDILALYLREQTKNYNMKENNDKTEEDEPNFWKLDCDELDEIYDPASQVAYGSFTVNPFINPVVIEEGSTTSDRGIDETNNNNDNQSQQNNNNNEEEEKEDQQGNDTNKSNPENNDNTNNNNEEEDAEKAGGDGGDDEEKKEGNEGDDTDKKKGQDSDTEEDEDDSDPEEEEKDPNFDGDDKKQDKMEEEEEDPDFDGDDKKQENTVAEEKEKDVATNKGDSEDDKSLDSVIAKMHQNKKNFDDSNSLDPIQQEIRRKNVKDRMDSVFRKKLATFAHSAGTNSPPTAVRGKDLLILQERGIGSNNDENSDKENEENKRKKYTRKTARKTAGAPHGRKTNPQRKQKEGNPRVQRVYRYNNVPVEGPEKPKKTKRKEDLNQGQEHCWKFESTRNRQSYCC